MTDPLPISDEERADLVAYLDGEVDAETQHRVEARLGHHPQFREEAQAFKKVWDLLDHLPRPQVSTEFTARTLDRISIPVEAVPTPATLVPSQPAPQPLAPRTRPGLWPLALALTALCGFLLPLPPRDAAPPRIDLDTDPVFAANPRLIENLPLYLAIEDMDFLLALDQPDLFAEEAPFR